MSIKLISLSTQDQIKTFFSQVKPQHFVSFREFSQTFPYDTNYIQKINNLLLNGYTQYRNYCLSELLPYKYVPVALFALAQMVRVRPPPLVLPLLFVYAMDYYFLEYFMWKNRDQKIINIQQGFNYRLIKKETQIKRNRYLDKYLQFLNRDRDRSFPEKGIDLATFSPYIFTLGAHNPNESYCYLTKQFDIYMAITHINSSFKDTITKIKKDWSLFGEFKKEGSTYNTHTLAVLENIQPYSRIHWADVLEQKINLYLEIFRYHMYNKTDKSRWKFQNLMSTPNLVSSQPKLIRVGSNSSELIIYYSLVALPYIITKFVRRG